MSGLAWMRNNRWSFSLLGVLALWSLLSAMTSHFNLNSLSGVASSASFLMIVAIGQMFVIASGSGNIDLSLPSVITVSAFVTLIFSQGTNTGLVLALPAVLAIGLATGAVNAFLVLKLRIPAIIATLAVGYVLDSATLIANRALGHVYRQLPVRSVTSSKLAGVPLILILALTLIAARGRHHQRHVLRPHPDGGRPECDSGPPCRSPSRPDHNDCLPGQQRARRAWTAPCCLLMRAAHFCRWESPICCNRSAPSSSAERLSPGGAPRPWEHSSAPFFWSWSSRQCRSAAGRPECRRWCRAPSSSRSWRPPEAASAGDRLALMLTAA